MNSEASIWLRIALLTGVEICLVVLFIAALERRLTKAAWRRNLCQAGLLTALLVSICEFSGVSRGIISCIAPGLVAGETHVGKSTAVPIPPVSPASGGESQKPSPRLRPEFRAEVQARLAERQRMDGKQSNAVPSAQSSLPPQAALPSANSPDSAAPSLLSL